MRKDSNDLSTIALLSGGLFTSGFYLGTFHFLPSISWVFFSGTVTFLGLGLIQFVHRFRPFLPSPFSRFLCWLHSMIFEALAIICTLLMLPLGFWRGVTRRYGFTGGKPILLIHGYLQNASNWTVLKYMLCKRKFGPIYTMNLFPPFLSICDYAKCIAQKADEIARETNCSDLTLIGHSMGGLASVWYATKLAPKEKMIDVITIGSPIAGTKLAAVAVGFNGREMRRGSHFIRLLQDAIAQSHQICFYHIASKTDELVLPFSSSLVGLDPSREYLLDDIGHFTLLFSPRVADKIEQWLALSRDQKPYFRKGLTDRSFIADDFDLKP